MDPLGGLFGDGDLTNQSLDFSIFDCYQFPEDFKEVLTLPMLEPPPEEDPNSVQNVGSSEFQEEAPTDNLENIEGRKMGNTSSISLENVCDISAGPRMQAGAASESIFLSEPAVLFDEYFSKFQENAMPFGSTSASTTAQKICAETDSESTVNCSENPLGQSGRRSPTNRLPRMQESILSGQPEQVDLKDIEKYSHKTESRSSQSCSLDSNRKNLRGISETNPANANIYSRKNPTCKDKITGEDGNPDNGSTPEIDCHGNDLVASDKPISSLEFNCTGNITDLQDQHIRCEGDGENSSASLQDASLAEYKCNVIHHEKLSKENVRTLQCEYSTKSAMKYQNHLQIHEPREAISCPECNNYQTRHKSLLEVHIKTHDTTTKLKYACSKCDYKSNHKGNMEGHQRRNHNSDRMLHLSCSNCEYRTDNSAHLKVHLETHIPNRERRYGCSDCSYKAFNEDSLKSHRKTHCRDENRKFGCSECNYSTIAKRYLKRHLRMHNPNRERLYGCPNCSYKAFDKLTLEKHRKTHNPDRKRSYACSDCTYRAFDERTLKKHCKTHYLDRERPYGCPDCGYRALNKRSLEKHRETHNPNRERPFGCQKCNYRTADEYNLRKHLRTHETQTVLPHTCSYCDYRTAKITHLRRHLLTMHDLAHSDSRLTAVTLKK